jgi:hypothetical protein
MLGLIRRLQHRTRHSSDYSVRPIKTTKCVARRTEQTHLISPGSQLAYSIAHSYMQLYKYILQHSLQLKGSMCPLPVGKLAGALCWPLAPSRANYRNVCSSTPIPPNVLTHRPHTQSHTHKVALLCPLCGVCMALFLNTVFFCTWKGTNRTTSILMVLLLHQILFRSWKWEECNGLGMQSACERSWMQTKLQPRNLQER